MPTTTRHQQDFPLTAVALGAFAIFVALDVLWIGVVNNAAYRSAVRAVQGAPLRLSPVGAALAYASLFVAIRFVALPAARQDPGAEHALAKAARWTALTAFVVYGTFNGTALAMFAKYPAGLAALDTAWGVFALTTSVTLALLAWRAVAGR